MKPVSYKRILAYLIDILIVTCIATILTMFIPVSEEYTNQMNELNAVLEDYYNQMALYKYFFEKSEGAKVSKTTFIYPENYTKNLELELCEADCEEVVDKFKNAISSIREYNFEPSHNKDVCKRCRYKDFCEMEIV